jgi:hypothetical protein
LQDKFFYENLKFNFASRLLFFSRGAEFFSQKIFEKKNAAHCNGEELEQGASTLPCLYCEFFFIFHQKFFQIKRNKLSLVEMRSTRNIAFYNSEDVSVQSTGNVTLTAK